MIGCILVVAIIGSAEMPKTFRHPSCEACEMRLREGEPVDLRPESTQWCVSLEPALLRPIGGRRR